MTPKSGSRANDEKQRSPRHARVSEPDVAGCEPQKRWRVRLIWLKSTGRHEIEITFFRRNGTTDKLRVDNARRSDDRYIVGELDSRNARLPRDKKEALEFVKLLVQSAPDDPLVAYDAPGFTEDGLGFVMPKRLYGSALGTAIWDANASSDFGSIEGDLATYQKGILKPAESSPYVTLAILIAMAGPVADYIHFKTRRKLLAETAIFHFAGESSSGKTTLETVALSVFGLPEATAAFDASDRGIVEAAHARNNLALVIDDTESAELGDQELFGRILHFAQLVPRGYSRKISCRSSNANVAHLRWSCFGISSGPETVASLAQRLGRERHGDRVRIFDIQLPPKEDGGIFGSDVTADGVAPRSSAALVAGIEEAILRAHGVLFDAWIERLLERDVSDELCRYFDEFVEHVAGGSDGLERRFATKFAILYAVGRVGVRMGLLPWPGNWPMRAVRHGYENALANRDPGRAAALVALRRLAADLSSSERFPRDKGGCNPYARWSASALGIRVVRERSSKTYVAQDRLGGSGTEPDVFALLLELGMLVRSGGRTDSEQLRVRARGGEVVRVRFWRLRAQMLRDWASGAAGKASSNNTTRRPRGDATTDVEAATAAAIRPDRRFASVEALRLR